LSTAPRQISSKPRLRTRSSSRVNERLERAYAAALTVVREQEEAIDFLADRLFEAGTLDGPDLDNVLDEVRKRFRERPG
jgi:cell division protease FtsH